MKQDVLGDTVTTVFVSIYTQNEAREQKCTLEAYQRIVP